MAEAFHQFENAFSDLEKLAARFGDEIVRQKLFWPYRFQARLRFVQVIERALQAGEVKALS